MSDFHPVRLCPACGADGGQSVGAPATGFPCDAGPEFPFQPEYGVIACQVCGLYYKSVVPSAETLQRYYSDLDSTPFSGDWDFPTDRETLRLLRGLPSGSRVLDYGCSTGRLLERLGSAYVRSGVEVNAAAASIAAGKGITIIDHTAVESGTSGDFDAILLTDVFEHLEKPQDLLARLAARLAPGGRLIMVTGLVDGVRDRALLAENWYFRGYGHLHMASERHLDWLGKRLGLAHEARIRCCHYRRDWAETAKQELQRVSYWAARASARSAAARAVSRLPGLSRARRWSNIPSMTQVQDHVVASMVKHA